ncbi:MAG TPA: O-antigen ligase family protein [Gaiellaceae bacterium]|nr:O-antigen ligase family protein [Gaiellaceae bacterium]
MTTIALDSAVREAARRVGFGAGIGLVLALAAAIGVLAAREPVLGIGAGLTVLVGAAVLRLPDVATIAVLAIVYSNAAVNAVKLHGVPYIAGAAVPLLLILPLIYHLVVRRRPLVVGPALPFLGLLFVVQIASTLTSSNPAASLGSLTVFAVEGVGLYLLLTNVVRTFDLLRTAVWTLLLLGAFLGALSLFQQLTGAFDNDFGGFAQVSQAAFVGDTVEGQEIFQKRLAGPIGEQNRYAQIMLVLLPLALFRIWGERRQGLRVLAGGCAALIAVGVALTFSRGAGVGFAAVLVAMTVMRTIRVRQLIIVAAGVLILLSAMPAYQARLSTLASLVHVGSESETGPKADGAADSRAVEAGAAALVVLDHPLLGVGPGRFKSHYVDYAKQVGLDGAQNQNRQAHNLYLGAAAETGLLGLAALLGVFVVTLRALSRVRRRLAHERPELAGMANGFLLAIVAYMTTGMFLHLAFERYLWLLLALAGVTCVLGRAAEAELAARSARERSARTADVPLEAVT